MKTKNKERSQSSNIKSSSLKGVNHYFHADEDFREDHSWGKPGSRSQSSKSKPDINVKNG